MRRISALRAKSCKVSEGTAISQQKKQSRIFRPHQAGGKAMQLKKHARCYRAILVAIMAIFLTNCGGGGSSDPDIVDKTPGTLREYILVWSDEFDSPEVRSLGVDLDNCNIETGYGPDDDGWGNDESQLYTNSPDNLRVENGNLIITARCDSGICGVRDDSIT